MVPDDGTWSSRYCPVIKIRIIAVGKDKDVWLSDGLAQYEKMLSRYARLEWIPIPAEKAASMSPAEIKRREAERIRKQLGRGMTVALADQGEGMDSPALARQLEQWQGRCDGTISFVIGGAFGLDQTVIGSVDHVLSLSPLTFSHQLVRLVLLEQLFRAFSILHGTDYHK